MSDDLEKIATSAKYFNNLLNEEQPTGIDTESLQTNNESKELQLDLSTEEVNQFVELYLKRTLSEESYSMYSDRLAVGATMEEAVFQAIFNEGVIDCLRHFIFKNTNNKIEP
jgi:hypothetical protein